VGIRYRKSFKIAPGVKLNLNAKSASFTGGVHGAHVTYSSKGYRTTSAGLPGTGLFYRTTRKVARTSPSAAMPSRQEPRWVAVFQLAWLACFALFILAVVGVLAWALFATGHWALGLVVAAVPVLGVLYLIGRVSQTSK
jgi:hypothetical protein